MRLEKVQEARKVKGAGVQEDRDALSSGSHSG
jgi:hypothetical protein